MISNEQIAHDLALAKVTAMLQEELYLRRSSIHAETSEQIQEAQEAERERTLNINTVKLYQNSYKKFIDLLKEPESSQFPLQTS